MINYTSRAPGSARGPFLHKMRMLMAPEPSGGGGGGGGGGGAPAGGDQGLSQQAIDQMNAIVTARLQKFDFSAAVDASVTKAMAPALEKLSASVSEQVAKIAQAAQPGAGGGDDKGKGKGAPAGGDAASEAVRNEMAQMKATIDSMKADAQKKDEAIAKAARDLRDKTVDDSFGAALTKLKVRPELAAAAQLAIKARAGEVSWEKDGAKDVAKIKVKRDKYGQQYEESITPEAYATEWAETPEGKGFLAAPGGTNTNSGRRPGGTVINRNGQQPQVGPNGQPQRQRPGITDDALGRMVIDAYAGGGGDE